MTAVHQVLLGQSAATGYKIQNSLRFRASNSANATRTNAAAGNAQKATFSFWVKRGQLGTGQAVFGANSVGSNYFYFGFASSDQFVVMEVVTSTQYHLQTSAVFRDPSAWYHIVLAIDTTQATAANRVRIYANGVEITSFSTNSPPSLNYNHTHLNANARVNYLGGSSLLGWLDAYLAKFHYIEGQQLTPSSFGKFDSPTNVWVPIPYTGTYGTLGSLHEFEDATSTTTIVKDTSGNNNAYTSSGISVTSGTTFDQMTDTPTLGYAVMNPLSKSSTPTPAQGNLFISMGAVYPANVLGSIGVSSGKFYFETSLSGTGGSANGYAVGVATGNWANLNADPGGNSTSYTHLIDSRALFSNNAATTNNSTSFTAGDIIGIAIDADNLTITFYKNNVQVGSAQTLESGQTWFPMFKNSTSAATLEYTANFGQRAFAYTPPSGFKALNTANLPTPSIKKGSLYMDATLRTGTGATASVSSLSFAPDLVWIKSRSAATNNNLFDTSRGATVGLVSQTVTAEYTDANSLTAFSSNGYSLGSDASSRGVNINTNTYVDWAWKEGATPGFDVVLYTGNGANRTVSHSLGAAPACYVCKYRSGSNADEWFMYHKSLGATRYIRWSQALASSTGSTYWNDTEPTSSVFSLGTNIAINTNGSLYVAYLWSEIEGFSKFGSYTGNGSTDGPFVWCGFRPKFVLVKNKDAAVNWVIQDAARSASNPSDPTLYPDLGNAEGTSENVDFLSNGFKPRNTLSRWNANANTFIFAAFAETPFKYARAR